MRSRRLSGFSLVELMVGLTIGLLLMAALSYLFVDNSRARTELDQSMQQLENGRYAMQLLREELRLAGYYGPAYSFTALPAALPDPCATDAASLEAAAPLAVQGYAPASSTPLACLAAANYRSNTAVLVVRRARTETVSVADAAASTADDTTVYLQANGDGMVVDTGANTANFILTSKGAASSLRPLSVHVYFVSPCDMPAGNATSCTGANDDAGNPVPTLKRLDITATGSQPVPLAPGVERFHIEYGVDTTGDGAPDSYVTSIATVADWANVVTARIHLLVRNTRPTPGYEDKKTYRLGNVVVNAANDAYKRHVFSETVRLTNVSGRRET